MNKSEQIDQLATALNKAQAEMTPALKDANNPFFKSKYADLTSVWKAVSEPLAKHGLSVSQLSKVAEPFYFQDANGNNNVIIGVIVETVLLHESGQWISGEAYAPLAKSDAQGVGSATTYLRRYGLSAILGVVAEDDDGNSASGKSYDKPYQQQSAPKAEPPIVDYLGVNTPAKKKEAKLKAICTGLNKSADQYVGADAKRFKWNSETVNMYCQDNFDKPLNKLDTDEVDVLVSDLTDRLEERKAMQENVPEMATEAQVNALITMAGIKGKDELEIAMMFSDGNSETFANLTNEEAQQALKGLPKM